MKVDFPQVFQLGLSEKLQLMEDLWDSIAATPDQIPVADWQKQELDARELEYLRNPGSGSSWEDVKRRIRTRDG